MPHRRWTGLRWKRKRTRTFPATCWESPGYVHWRVEQDGYMVDSDFTIHDGKQNTNADANSSVGPFHRDRGEIRKQRHALTVIRDEIDAFLEMLDEAEERAESEAERYKVWRAEREADGKG